MQAQQVLHKIMKNTCPNMHKTRRDALEANVLAALIGRRLTVSPPTHYQIYLYKTLYLIQHPRGIIRTSPNAFWA